MPSRKLIRSLLLVTGTLVFVFAAILILRHGSSRPSAPFANKVDQAEKITIQLGGSSMELVRDSQTWSVSSASGGGPYRAHPERIKVLLRMLRETKVEDVISERAESAEDFEVNPASGAHVTLFGPGNSKLAEGIFGKQAPDGVHVYFKFPDAPAVRLARGAFRGELGNNDLRAWRDRAILTFVESQALSLVIEGPGFKTALARSSDTWSSNGKVVDPAPVWGLLGQLAHLAADDFVDPAQTPQAAADPLTYASILIQLTDGGTLQLRIGRRDAAQQRHPVATGDPGRAWVNETAIKNILRKPSDFKPQ
jgi:hypothetical protein